MHYLRTVSTNSIIGNMASEIDKLTAQVLALPADARAALADRLTESLDPLREAGEIRAVWAREALRRRDEMRSGKVESISAEEALARARSYLGK